MKTIIAFLILLLTSSLSYGQATWDYGTSEISTANKVIIDNQLRVNDGNDKLTFKVNNLEDYSKITWGDNLEDKLYFHFDHWNGESNDKNVMTLLSNGRVGIGTDNPTYSNLHIYRNTTTGGWGSIDPTKAVLKVEDASANLFIDGNSLFTDGNMNLGTVGEKRLTFGTNNSEHVRIDADGHVGVGTTEPAHDLHVVGSTLFKGETKITGPLLFAKGMESVLANSTNPAIYETHDMDGDYPFNTSGHLVIQPETTYSKDIVMMTGNGTPDVRMVVLGNGRVGIGTRTPTAKFSVAGKMDAREIKVEVEAGATPDYVFADDYELSTLEETASFINENHHLPEVPSAKEMEANGMNVGEMNLLLLRKVEELTLHLIDLAEKDKEKTILIKKMQDELDALKPKNN
ncbi:hypothetical protein [Reichenbachiella sp.]|uniref:hypothetical protein n=1 Tax=Reichenbachiella sp. TaxID=2184521 RepID=UPI003BB01902